MMLLIFSILFTLLLLFMVAGNDLVDVWAQVYGQKSLTAITNSWSEERNPTYGTIEVSALLELAPKLVMGNGVDYSIKFDDYSWITNATANSKGMYRLLVDVKALAGLAGTAYILVILTANTGDSVTNYIGIKFSLGKTELVLNVDGTSTYKDLSLTTPNNDVIEIVGYFLGSGGDETKWLLGFVNGTLANYITRTKDTGLTSPLMGGVNLKIYFNRGDQVAGDLRITMNELRVGII